MALSVASGELSKFERYLLIVIAILSRRSPLRTTQADLARIANVSPNTVQRVLPKLQSKGLIKLRRQQLGRGIPDETQITLLIKDSQARLRQTDRVQREEDPRKRPGRFYPSEPRPKRPPHSRPKGPETRDLFRDQ